MLPHTLDNLCSPEKEKVVDMLKQLSELKKRCTVLEETLEGKQRENEKNGGREEVLARQLDSIQGKLLETVESSGELQQQIEGMSLKLQKAQSEGRALSLRLQDSQAEAKSLRDNIREIEAVHNRVLVATGTQVTIIHCGRSCNTDDSAIDVQNAWVQVGPDAFPPPSRTQSPVPIRTPPPASFLKTPDGVSSADLDDELAQLISLLTTG
jgi:hypothetical protein